MPRRRGDRGRGREDRIAETLGKNCPPWGTQAQTAGRGSEVGSLQLEWIGNWRREEESSQGQEEAI